MSDLTGAQGAGIYPGMTGVAEAEYTLPASYNTYREMRKHPTIALARLLHIAPILNGKWSVGSEDEAPEGAVQLVENNLLPLRKKLLKSALESRIDFGFAPYEIVWTPAPAAANQIDIGKIKALLQDLTVILVDRATGEVAGLKQNDIIVPVEKALLLSGNIECQNWYGRPLLENIRSTYNKWLDVEARASQYDRKVAGANVVIKYPPGSTTKVNGAVVDNYDYALELFRALQTSGGIILPQPDVLTYKTLSIEQLQSMGWEFEHFADESPKQITFVPRFEYLDKLMFRGMLWPERAISEGHFGTKAEAEVHADFGILNLMAISGEITAAINEQVVDRLLILNYGIEAKGTAYLEDAPLVDVDLAYMREVFMEAWRNPQGLLQLIHTVDFDQLLKSLGIPKAEEVIQPRTVGDVGTDEPGAVAMEHPNDTLVRQIYENGNRP